MNVRRKPWSHPNNVANPAVTCIIQHAATKTRILHLGVHCSQHPTTLDHSGLCDVPAKKSPSSQSISALANSIQSNCQHHAVMQQN